MKKILLSVLFILSFCLVKAQYPITQNLGSANTLVQVPSPGGLTAALIMRTFADTTAANATNIDYYSGAIIYTTNDNKMWVRHYPATQWDELGTSGGSTNIYNSDGTLTGTRLLAGDQYGLTFDDLTAFDVNANAAGGTGINLQGGDARFIIQDTMEATQRISYLTNLHSTFTQYTLIDKAFADSLYGKTFAVANRDTIASAQRRFNANSNRFVMVNISPFGSSVGSGLYTGSVPSASSTSAGAYFGFTLVENPEPKMGLHNSVEDSYFTIPSTGNGTAQIHTGKSGTGTRDFYVDPLLGYYYSSVPSADNTDSIYTLGSDGYAGKMSITRLGTLIAAGGGAWTTTGNSGLTPGTNFLGTTDNVALSFRVSNQKSGYIDYTSTAITSYGYLADSARVGTYSSAFGAQALQLNAGSYNSAFGAYAMKSNTTGEQNTAIGVNSLLNNTTGQKNMSGGAGAMENNTTGSFNVAVGQDALLWNRSGSGKIGVGWNAGSKDTTGDNSIYIGYGTGSSLTYADGVIAIGRAAAWQDWQKDSLVRSIIIGQDAAVTEDSVITLGANYHKKTYLRGQLIDSSYGSGTYTGTIAYYLGVTADGQVVEGAGSSGAYWPLSGSASLTGSTSIDVNGNHLLIGNADSAVFSYNPTDNSISIGDNANSIQFNVQPRDRYLLMQADDNEFIAFANGDSMAITTPGTIRMRDSSIATASNGYVWKLIDATSGKGAWQASSGGTPAGNFGNIQINRNGAFATPSSDSLNFTSGTGLNVKGSVSANATTGSASLNIITTGGTHSLTGDNSGQLFINGWSTTIFRSGGTTFAQGYNGKLLVRNGGGTGTAELQTESTSEQFRAAYDGSNYMSLTVGSSGVATFNAAGSGQSFVFSDPLTATSLTTADPGSGAGTWKLGTVQTATVALDTTQYVEITIGGTTYKLALVNIP